MFLRQQSLFWEHINGGFYLFWSYLRSVFQVPGQLSLVFWCFGAKWFGPGLGTVLSCLARLKVEKMRCLSTSVLHLVIMPSSWCLFSSIRLYKLVRISSNFWMVELIELQEFMTFSQVQTKFNQVPPVTPRDATVLPLGVRCQRPVGSGGLQDQRRNGWRHLWELSTGRERESYRDHIFEVVFLESKFLLTSLPRKFFSNSCWCLRLTSACLDQSPHCARLDDDLSSGAGWLVTTCAGLAREICGDGRLRPRTQQLYTALHFQRK